MASFQELLAAYDYDFPPELIAKEPASPRDSAKLLIYNRKRGSIQFDTFTNIADYLPPNALVVFNKTKVIPAKLTLRKSTGGVVKALLLSTHGEGVTVLASGSFKAGDTLFWKDGHSFSVRRRLEEEAVLIPSFPITQISLMLEKYGETPLPPYMKDSPLPETRRREEYQTVFATDNGSVAAPTAGLHFTKELIKKIVQSGRITTEVTLHVHLGTFAPLREEQWRSKRLHTEWYSIEQKAVQILEKAKAEGRPIVAVGTTTVRTLESAEEHGKIIRPEGETSLFITEDSPIHFVDHLITNFHVPRSSLLMLVSAFTGREKLLEIYKQAVDKRMRLFSFGDGMLIL